MTTHRRIRPFNTRDTYPEQRLDNDLAQAVLAEGRLLFLRGQCPQDLDTAQNVGIGDPVAQAHVVMRNIRTLVEEAGGRMEHVVKLVVYLTDVRHREPVYRVMGEYIRGVHPVCTGLVVVALARPEWLVEIDATAVLPALAPPERRILLVRARAMRKGPTPAERMLWRALRNDALGYSFRRQAPIGPYIVDFHCPACRLAVEVDGETHAEPDADSARDTWLEAHGVQVARFRNNEVTGSLPGVLAAIATLLRTAPSVAA